MLERPSGERFDLPYGYLAIALYASPSLPFPGRARLSPDQVAAYAEEGSAQLGGVDNVRALHAEWIRLNEDLLRDELDSDGYEAALREWLQSARPSHQPCPERLYRCIGYDYRRLLRI